MNQKIETSLRRAVQDLPAPSFQKIASAPVQRMEVHDYITRQMPVIPVRSRRLPAALAACAAAVMLAAGLYVYTQFFQIYSVVDLTINPAFAIELNRQDEVRGIEALNGDAGEILEGRSYKGWALNTAVSALLDELSAKGYLSSAEDEVSISVNSKNADHGRELREELSAFIEHRLVQLQESTGGDVQGGEPVTDPAPQPSESAGPTAPEPSLQPGGAEVPTGGQPSQALPQLLTEAEAVAVIQAWKPAPDIRKLELDIDEDEAKYEVEFISQGVKYEVEIEAYTGTIIKWEIDD